MLVRSRWCSIPDLETMGLEEVADWHDFLVADEEAADEARRKASPKPSG